MIMGYGLLEKLHESGVETHLVISENAIVNFQTETELRIETVYGLADHVYDNQNLAAVISSGSFVTDGMVIIPSSMKTLAGIVNGFSTNLLLRAADVCLKEGRKVVLVPREMPFSRVHLENLCRAAAYGCSIVPPVLTFYNNLQTTEQQVHHVIAKAMMQFGLVPYGFKAWEGLDGHD